MKTFHKSPLLASTKLDQQSSSYFNTCGSVVQGNSVSSTCMSHDFVNTQLPTLPKQIETLNLSMPSFKSPDYSTMVSSKETNSATLSPIFDFSNHMHIQAEKMTSSAYHTSKSLTDKEITMADVYRQRPKVDINRNKAVERASTVTLDSTKILANRIFSSKEISGIQENKNSTNPSAVSIMTNNPVQNGNYNIESLPCNDYGLLVLQRLLSASSNKQ